MRGNWIISRDCYWHGAWNIDIDCERIDRLDINSRVIDSQIDVVVCAESRRGAEAGHDDQSAVGRSRGVFDEGYAVRSLVYQEAGDCYLGAVD